MRYQSGEIKTYVFLINLGRNSSMEVGTKPYYIEIPALPVIEGVSLDTLLNLSEFHVLYL